MHQGVVYSEARFAISEKSHLTYLGRKERQPQNSLCDDKWNQLNELQIMTQKPIKAS
jgi:hypothetical protein